MKILALEFSSSQRSVALLQASVPLQPDCIQSRVNEAIQTGGRAVNAVAMTEEVLHAGQVEREQIECLAVALGPGSYTGIRAAIAFAQGWQLASPRTSLFGISSVEVLAAQSQLEGIHGRVWIVIDAQRDEFYLAGYDLTPAARCQVEGLRLASKDEVQAHEHADGTLVGPEITRWFPTARPLFPRAAMTAQLALARTDFVSGEKLEPIYLRETKFVKAPPPRAVR